MLQGCLKSFLQIMYGFLNFRFMPLMRAMLKVFAHVNSIAV